MILSDAHALKEKEDQTGVVPASGTGAEIEKAGKEAGRADVKIASRRS